MSLKTTRNSCVCVVVDLEKNAENIEGAVKNGQTTEAGNIGYTRRKKDTSPPANNFK
jgi:hypothetical protein